MAIQKSPQELAEDIWTVFQIVEGLWDCDNLSETVWQPALRFASTCDGAPARCSRRRCHVDGECQMVVGDEPSLTCDGGLSDETILKAARHVVFTVSMIRSHAQHLMCQLPVMLDFMSERLSAPPRRKGGAARKPKGG